MQPRGLPREHAQPRGRTPPVARRATLPGAALPPAAPALAQPGPGRLGGVLSALAAAAVLGHMMQS
ncbi:hypothetical protein GCM10011320_44730 [Neoroseomonas lacus]|uniref:Uncharacterized protein n=1 Tax=Neoroseomonas lacus TaxID=287609 RepID=A0A917NVG2_9PROT|nr:hypothetical protein GCM10011320_44730 [Neoroseomonas lacus]